MFHAQREKCPYFLKVYLYNLALCKFQLEWTSFYEEELSWCHEHMVS